MSIRIMSKVWESGPEKQSHLLVMLALADFSNDDGECWPSIKSISEKCRMTERGVQKIVRALEDDGWLQISTGNGRGGCNQYKINPEPRSDFNALENPEPRSPRTTFTLNSDAETPNNSAKTLNGGSPEPSRTVIEPSVSNDAREIFETLSKWASPEPVRSFIAYRRKQKGKALTVTAAIRQAAQLERIFKNGGDPDDALGLAEERGWQSVQADWYFKAKGHENDNRDCNRSGQSADMRQNRPDPALEQALRLAGLS